MEQIKLAEEVKITKEKIKEVEEEWQNNLMSWKSKRKLTKNNSEGLSLLFNFKGSTNLLLLLRLDESLMQRNPNRKTKTFSEILHEKARSGARIGYNLHKYVDAELEEEFDIPKGSYCAMFARYRTSLAMTSPGNCLLFLMPSVACY